MLNFETRSGFNVSLTSIQTSQTPLYDRIVSVKKIKKQIKLLNDLNKLARKDMDLTGYYRGNFQSTVNTLRGNLKKAYSPSRGNNRLVVEVIPSRRLAAQMAIYAKNNYYTIRLKTTEIGRAHV